MAGPAGDVDAFVAASPPFNALFIIILILLLIVVADALSGEDSFRFVPSLTMPLAATEFSSLGQSPFSPLLLSRTN